MKKFIIVVLPTEEGENPSLSTRKQFDSKEAAETHILTWAEGWRKYAMVVECHHGLTYYDPEKIKAALETGLRYTSVEGSRAEEMKIVEALYSLTNLDSYKEYRDKLVPFVEAEKKAWEDYEQQSK